MQSSQVDAFYPERSTRALEVSPADVRLEIVECMTPKAVGGKQGDIWHAGVVGWQDRALLLPGTSFAGKTTLVAELVRAGATYYSDEYAVLDQHGRVYSYPRDLQMRLAGSPQQSAVAVEHLTGTVGTSPLSVSRVVFTEYRESGHWNPEPVSAGMAVLEMLWHAIPVQRTPARVMATLARMMETATAVRSERGEASEAANSLLTAIPLGGAPV
jgi:hypothetical protein